ncbi:MULTISPECIES: energy-coupling factor transporter transmembrane component T family protein [Rhizobiaceae]|jgi:biotin transport system permease protein|uniref:Biotin transport system permease protein n=1 Tax=Aliirhizobium cellulosilyticum TaxID=393664 RepID=A0A7W6XAH4_9HYPH|nr:energy-coupling factor transporter transmembrane protein EcfT [Rhizobium cellulosilyticum]MBB4348449.1 biotin transport system permease protein [Rhizobium cellulosilyticum]MBB4411685.1 biotin transport system permease protein [Rhizobium cellulosilyticum]MBB4446376.1 biotin transport system permease protein [Rhizobium cellulosilyticum]
MRSLHINGDSVLHRLPAAVKLAALAIISLILFMINNAGFLAGAAFAGLAGHALLRISTAEIWRRMRPFALIVVVVALFTATFNGTAEGLTAFFRLAALALFASLVTATTTTGDFIDVITRAAMPLERLGILKARDVGLSIGLVIRFVPEILSRYEVIRDAHYARGLKPRPVSLIVPLIITTLQSADEIAAAIDARGIRSQK